jgi:uncharacterized membrane protein YeaQ/YmgE (transglycosylase-associated protein family)
MGIISWLVVGLVAGWITGKIMGSHGKGVLMDIIIGLLGALVGGFLAGIFGFRAEGGFVYTTILAVFGAIILTWVFRKLTSRHALTN